MKNILKSSIASILTIFERQIAHKNQFLVSTTPKGDVMGLIEKLKPLAITHPLVRLGPDGDGGYLVPDVLTDVKACFSPGVSEISGFEQECAEKGMSVFLADHSVDAPAESHPQFHFTKKYIGSSSQGAFITLDDWVNSSVPNDGAELLLQMDIEGFEYEVLLSLSKELQSKFKVIVIEFHFMDQLWNAPYFSLVSRAFEKLLESHSCVHIHPNNYAQPYDFNGVTIPPLMEMTFLRKDCVEISDDLLAYPHALDADNTTNESVVLPKQWFGSDRL